MTLIRALLLAIQLLTILKVRISQIQSQELGLSVLFFPIVGLIIGLLLNIIKFLLFDIDHNILSIIIITTWILITGGIHMDGLADTADAWIGGLGNQQLTLDIMKDPNSGPIAIVILVIVILAKHVSLKILMHNGELILLVTPILGRTFLLLLLLNFPYIRSQGLATKYLLHMPKIACKIMVCIVLICTIFLFNILYSVTLLLTLFIFFEIIRRTIIARLGGITGDILGASCEIVETIMLMCGAIFVTYIV